MNFTSVLVLIVFNRIFLITLGVLCAGELVAQRCVVYSFVSFFEIHSY